MDWLWVLYISKDCLKKDTVIAEITTTVIHNCMHGAKQVVMGKHNSVDGKSQT